jgi:hypothetical protein
MVRPYLAYAIFVSTVAIATVAHFWVKVQRALRLPTVGIMALCVMALSSPRASWQYPIEVGTPH